MTQVKKPMVDEEKVRMNEITAARHARLVAQYGEVIATAIEVELAQVELNPHVISARVMAAALDENTAAINANTAAIREQRTQKEETEFDRVYREARSNLSLSRLEIGLLTCHIPPHVDKIRDAWHLLELWKYNQTTPGEEAIAAHWAEQDRASAKIESRTGLATSSSFAVDEYTAPFTFGESKPVRKNWKWKRCSDAENRAHLFSKIQVYFEKHGKLPTSTQFYKFYQVGYDWALKHFDHDWKNVINAFIKEQ